MRRDTERMALDAALTVLPSGQVVVGFGIEDDFHMLVRGHRPLLMRAVFLVRRDAADWDQVQ